jgi:hypothetical protein
VVPAGRCDLEAKAAGRGQDHCQAAVPAGHRDPKEGRADGGQDYRRGVVPVGGNQANVLPGRPQVPEKPCRPQPIAGRLA